MRLILTTMLGVMLFASPGVASTTMTFDSGLLDMDLPDGNPSGVTSVITLPDDMASGDALEHLAVSIAMDHIYVGDVTIRLTAPDATVLTLVDQPGSASASGDPQRDYPIVFDDAHATPAWQLGTQCRWIGMDCTADFAPTDPLAGVLGNFEGDWTLQVVDGYFGYTGTLASWSLQATFTPVPEPSALVLIALGLTGLAAYSRPRRSQS